MNPISKGVKITQFRDIPQFTDIGHYAVHSCCEAAELVGICISTIQAGTGLLLLVYTTIMSA